MSLSRWKVMAGVLGVTVGGLAAFGGQAIKPGQTNRTADVPLVPVVPAMPPAGTGAAKPVALPDAPPPPSPVAPSVTAPTPDAVIVPSAPPKVAAPELPPLVKPAAALDVPAVPLKAPPVLETPPAPVTPPALPTTPQAAVEPPAAVAPAAPISDPLLPPPAPAAKPPVAPPPAPAAAAPAPIAAPTVTKFRILLRVGEGEPSFEVRQGDDLMMKVVCEKVDVKSPEKGSGPSAVKATGKVRFVGFGAEGTCDELSFMAGTGEVAMTGTVKVQVKDKLGRIDSELTSDKLHYRLDTGAMPVGIKP